MGNPPRAARTVRRRAPSDVRDGLAIVPGPGYVEGGRSVVDDERRAARHDPLGPGGLEADGELEALARAFLLDDRPLAEHGVRHDPAHPEVVVSEIRRVG